MLATGKKLGPYEIVGSLGAGGMGEVYRALDSKLGRQVALKILPDEWRGDGREIFFVDADLSMMAAAVDRTKGIRVADPVKLFDTELQRGDGHPYVVTNDRPAVPVRGSPRSARRDGADHRHQLASGAAPMNLRRSTSAFVPIVERARSVCGDSTVKGPDSGLAKNRCRILILRGAPLLGERRGPTDPGCKLWASRGQSERGERAGGPGGEAPRL